MKKVMIVGICGAGKSTFALTLSQRTSLPVFHLDQYFWKEGWKQPHPDEWLKSMNKLVQMPEWIIEGNYSSSFDLRMKEADTLMILDYHPLIAIFRATKRILKYYGSTRPDMTEGCPERFNWDFYKFLWNFNKNHRPRLDQAIDIYGKHLKVLKFNSPKHLQKYIDNEL